jgi:putative SOS response-associated peptidase YedK
MCGRFTQTRELAELKARFAVSEVRAPIEPRFNIAPTSPVAVVLRDGGAAVLDAFRWGLVPAWAKALKGQPSPINARAETLASSGMFRRLLARRRCLVPADGVYEWTGTKKQRSPVRIHLRDEAPFAFAGLWDSWRDPADPGAPELRTCTIVTIPANSLIAPIHDRMPVILAPEDEARWLDPALEVPAALALLRPFDPERMALYRVSSIVNDVRNKGPECIAPAA